MVKYLVIILLLCACQKETLPDCDCGIVLSNTNNGMLWTTIVQNNCSLAKDTIVWHFSMDDCWQVGNIICKLPNIDLDTLK